MPAIIWEITHTTQIHQPTEEQCQEEDTRRNLWNVNSRATADKTYGHVWAKYTSKSRFRAGLSPRIQADEPPSMPILQNAALPIAYHMITNGKLPAFFALTSNPEEMAVFFKNDCKFHGCGKPFPSLCSLIEHIEAVHIDFDPKVTAEFEDQGTTGIPLSYVLKYSHCRHVHETTSADLKVRLIQHATKSALEKQNGFVARHHLQDEETFSESESSNDSWTPTKEVILPERKNGASALLWKDKPFVCSVPGCKKRYKNINGIKYHYKNGHKIFEKSKKSIKAASRKGNKGRNVKISAKKMCLEKALTVQLPTTSKVTDTTLGLGNEHCDIVVPEQADKEKYISLSLNTNNNNECHPADCTSTYVNTCIQWPAAASARSDLTIIRPSIENSISNNFVAYFSDCSNSQHAS